MASHIKKPPDRTGAAANESTRRAVRVAPTHAADATCALQDGVHPSWQNCDANRLPGSGRNRRYHFDAVLGLIRQAADHRAAHLRRQQGLNHRPLEIRQIKARHTCLPLFRSNESEPINQRKTLMGMSPGVVHFRNCFVSPAKEGKRDTESEKRCKGSLRLLRAQWKFPDDSGSTAAPQTLNYWCMRMNWTGTSWRNLTLRARCPHHPGTSFKMRYLMYPQKYVRYR